MNRRELFKALATVPVLAAAPITVFGGDIKPDPISINDGHWHHIVMTRKDDLTCVWVDGIQAQSVQASETFEVFMQIKKDHTYSLWYCKDADGFMPAEGGKVDIMSYWDRPLTASEIYELNENAL